LGNYAFVADGSSGLQIINISNPNTPTLAGSYDTPGYTEGVQVVGNYAYITDAYSGELQVINISNPNAPTLTDSYYTNAQDVQVVGNYAFVAVGSSGLGLLTSVIPILSPSLVPMIAVDELMVCR
jgi:hypothetical protein